MKPEYASLKVLKYTQSIAKMIEFDVSEDDRNIEIPKNPEELFALVIGMLGDISEKIISTTENNEDCTIQESDIRFCANFFDAYKNSKRLRYLDNYSLLIGAAAYYICNLPGSTQVLIRKIDVTNLELKASKLEYVLYWILKGDYSKNLIKINSCYGDYSFDITTAVCNYFLNGNNEKDVFESCRKFQNFAYNRNNPRELFFADLIFAICIKKIHNSCWKNLPIFTNLQKNIWAEILKRKSFFNELWPSQLFLGKENVFKGQSAVIQMPTSTGKTKSTEIIIRSAFLASRTNIAIIVAPFRALCHEIEHDFYYSFYEDKNISIDEINDAFEDTELSFFLDSSKKHIIILTPEKLYYLLTQKQDFTENIGLVIFDEGHQFDSGDRGVTYELLLTELKQYLRSDCQKILISAVIHNANQISDWLSPESKVAKNSKLLPTERSIGIVNFNYGVGQINFLNQIDYNQDDYFVPKIVQVTKLPKLKREKKSKNFPNKKDANSIALYLALKLSQKENVAIFSGQKASVNTVLELANDYFKRLPNNKKPKGSISEIQKLSFLISESFGMENNFYFASQNGIFAHHADIPYGIKIAIEYSMRESLISFIVCTSTLAQGVNLPIKYLFISSTQQGADKIKIRDFHNLIGRVGRAGKLTEGCIIFTNPNIYPKGSRQWNDVASILNPENSEDCLSSLLNIFEPFTNGKDTESISFKSIKNIIELYYNTNGDYEKAAEQINQHFPKYEIKKLKQQCNLKFRYIEKIENFLMLLGEKLSKENVIDIAKSTLAYKLASNELKSEITNLFIIIAEKIVEITDDKTKLPIYAKTLRGINQTFNLKERIMEKAENLLSITSSNDLLNVLWDIFLDDNIQNSAFNFYKDKVKLKMATLKWLDGESYFEIFKILEGEKINNHIYIKIESCVNIFENGLSYSGSILINAIMEILISLKDDNYNHVIEKLKLFQKQLKYGLPNIESILIYEWGFCDRTIAQKISTVIQPATEKYSIKMNILAKKEVILQILQKYPSYYETVFEKLIG